MTNFSDLERILNIIIYWCNYEFHAFGFTFSIFDVVGASFCLCLVFDSISLFYKEFY